MLDRGWVRLTESADGAMYVNKHWMVSENGLGLRKVELKPEEIKQGQELHGAGAMGINRHQVEEK